MLDEVGEMRVGERRPAGRPSKKWSECEMKDMNLLGVEAHVVQDRWMPVYPHPKWENTDIK